MSKEIQKYRINSVNTEVIKEEMSLIIAWV